MDLTLATPVARRARRWRVPPPLTRGSELLEGSELLAELPGAHAVLLWKSLRTVTLWANVPAEERPSLFAPGADRRRTAELLTTGLEPEVREPLATLARLLASAPVERAQVALACRLVAQWAERMAAPATALAFAQAAALACPADAELALDIGVRSEARGEQARAESWYRRTVVLARQSGQWEAYARAYLRLAGLDGASGAYGHARRALEKALRTARRHGLHQLADCARAALASAADLSAGRTLHPA